MPRKVRQRRLRTGTIFAASSAVAGVATSAVAGSRALHAARSQGLTAFVPNVKALVLDTACAPRSPTTGGLSETVPLQSCYCGSSSQQQVCKHGRVSRVARRLFDTGAIFGVGVPEAVVVGLLGWFLLGPEELFRLSKRFGSWLGELRSFVGQAAKQYETALDDESTRKAIDGIRQTQQTVSEISASWRSVADTLRDPLQIGSTLESTVNKYASAPSESKELASPEKASDSTKPEKVNEDFSTTPEPVEATAFDETNAVGPKESSAVEGEETAEELERKRAASREAVKDEKPTDGAKAPQDAEGHLDRLDDRLAELDDLTLQIEDLRSGLMEDRKALKLFMEERSTPSVTASTKKEDVNTGAKIYENSVAS